MAGGMSLSFEAAGGIVGGVTGEDEAAALAASLATSFAVAGPIGAAGVLVMGVLDGSLGDTLGNLGRKPDSYHDHVIKTYRNGRSTFDAAGMLAATKGNPDAMKSYREKKGWMGGDRLPGFNSRSYEYCPQFMVWQCVMYGLVNAPDLFYKNVGPVGQDCRGSGKVSNRLGANWKNDLMSICERIAKRDRKVKKDLDTMVRRSRHTNGKSDGVVRSSNPPPHWHPVFAGSVRDFIDKQNGISTAAADANAAAFEQTQQFDAGAAAGGKGGSKKTGGDAASTAGLSGALESPFLLWGLAGLAGLGLLVFIVK